MFSRKLMISILSQGRFNTGISLRDALADYIRTLSTDPQLRCSSTDPNFSNIKGLSPLGPYDYSNVTCLLLTVSAHDGRILPADIIRRFTVRYAGETVFSAELFPAIASNPYIAFHTLATASGTLVFTWEGDKGFTQSESVEFTVA